MIVLMFIMKLSSCMSSSCAPPPTLCDVLLCHVTCLHPPEAWDSHHVVVVIVSVRQEVSVILGKQF